MDNKRQHKRSDNQQIDSQVETLKQTVDPLQSLATLEQMLAEDEEE